MVVKHRLTKYGYEFRFKSRKEFLLTVRAHHLSRWAIDNAITGIQMATKRST